MQIRRSSYHDVVRVLEIQQALNVNGVQTYVINSSRVIFLNTRAPNNQHKPKNAGRISAKNNTKCVICTRNLVDPFYFCSLECKVCLSFIPPIFISRSYVYIPFLFLIYLFVYLFIFIFINKIMDSLKLSSCYVLCQPWLLIICY